MTQKNVPRVARASSQLENLHRISEVPFSSTRPSKGTVVVVFSSCLGERSSAVVFSCSAFYGQTCTSWTMGQMLNTLVLQELQHCSKLVQELALADTEEREDECRSTRLPSVEVACGIHRVSYVAMKINQRTVVTESWPL